MMHSWSTSAFVLAALTMIGACTAGTPLDDGPLAIDVSAGYTFSDVLAVELYRAGPETTVADTNDCLTIASDTAIVANGTPGALVNTGGLPFDADRCENPRLEVRLDPMPSSIDIELDDGSSALHLSVSQDVHGNYQVKRCDAATCSVL